MLCLDLISMLLMATAMAAVAVPGVASVAASEDGLCGADAAMASACRLARAAGSGTSGAELRLCVLLTACDAAMSVASIEEMERACSSAPNDSLVCTLAHSCSAAKKFPDPVTLLSPLGGPLPSLGYSTVGELDMQQNKTLKAGDLLWEWAPWGLWAIVALLGTMLDDSF